ncbi:MAG: hypothetical protein ABL957_01050 [Parvularculaceae bacterium]
MNMLRLGTCLIAFAAASSAPALASKKAKQADAEAANAAVEAIAPTPVLSGSAANLPMLKNSAEASEGSPAAPKAAEEKSSGPLPEAAPAPSRNAMKASARPAATGGDCASYEERVVPFTSWDAADRVAVRVVGKTCADASVLLSIADKDGRAIFAHAAILNQLNPRETTPAGMRKTVEGVWRIVGPRRTSDVAEWAPPKESYVAGDEMPLWGADQHEAARHSDMPLICYPQDGMSGQCVYYDQARASVRELVRLLGPTTFSAKAAPAAPAKASTRKPKTEESKGKED